MQKKVILFVVILFVLISILTIKTREYALPNQDKLKWAEKTVASLTIDEKIGQLFFIAVRANPGYSDDPLFKNIFTAFGLVEKHDREYALRMIQEHHIGGVLYICRSTILEQQKLTHELQQKSKLPLLFVQDFEWGLTMRLDDALRFPKNMTLGALDNDKLIYKMGKEIARQCKLIGVHMNLAPIFDVNNNPNNPIINDRSFGEDKEKITRKALAMMAGFQNGRILACPKHFPGHGDVEIDSHAALPLIPHDIKRLYDIELYPFIQAILHKADAIMTAHLHIPALDNTPGIPSSISPKIVSELLKKRLGFRGLIITDGLVMKGVTDFTQENGETELKALLAGNDILLFPKDVAQAKAKIKEALADGRLTEKQLDDSVLKILKSKQRCNLHKARAFKPCKPQDLHNKHARVLKKELYTQAITLVKNDTILPFKQAQQVTLIQVGGKADSQFMKSLSPLKPQIIILPAKPSEKEIEKTIKQVSQESIVIFGIFDMNKFAKENWNIAPETQKLIDQIKQNHKIILTLFGNAYSLKIFGKEDAIIVAYEDDPDAQEAAAHTILGAHRPTGKLPVTASNDFPAGCFMTF